ncbi:hypothetical protein [uncultured Psychrobacter sp.]|uniref:hypothetical protein n=1 Tax=uncultured Psychrobacter sp. TaxID=259303 RepID=UPI0030D9EB3F
MIQEKKKITLSLSAGEVETVNNMLKQMVIAGGFFPTENKSINAGLANYWLGYLEAKKEAADDQEVTIEISLRVAKSLANLLYNYTEISYGGGRTNNASNLLETSLGYDNLDTPITEIAAKINNLILKE